MCQNTEEKTKKNESELQKLLKKNAYGPGLTIEEYQRARFLINNPEYTKEDCWCYKPFLGEPKKTIFDTGLCQGHANYALATRK